MILLCDEIAELASLNIEAGDDEELFQFQTSIQESGQTLSYIIDNILNISNAEDHENGLSITDVNVRDLLAVLLAILETRISKQQIRVDITQIPPEAAIQADELKLQKIVHNLLDNAVKFPGNGTTVHVALTQKDREAVLSIKDQGIGIAAENHPLIFESFRQVEEGSCRKYGGVGLGLTIAQRLVDLHRGSIRLESELGQGKINTLMFIT